MRRARAGAVRGRAGRATHVDARGRARMVDVSPKPWSLREATAAGSISMDAAAFAALRSGALAKGDAAALARAAGIVAAKRTADLIPLCHPVPVEHLEVRLRYDTRRRAVDVEATARARWSTGVEMEALVAVSVALLTIYDMAKAIDRRMTLGRIRLLRKRGGRSGAFTRREP